MVYLQIGICTKSEHGEYYTRNQNSRLNKSVGEYMELEIRLDSDPTALSNRGSKHMTSLPEPEQMRRADTAMSG